MTKNPEGSKAEEKENTLVFTERSFNQSEDEFPVTYTREEIIEMVEKYFPNRLKQY